MPNRLSYSQMELYKTCSKAWEYHYVQRYRSTKVGSPLVFGGALGKAFEHGLNQLNDKTLTDSVYDVFKANWLNADVNGVMTNLRDSDVVEYSKYDFDKDLCSTPWECLERKGLVILEAFVSDFLPQVHKVYSTEEKVELFSGEDSSIGYADAVVELEGYEDPVIIDFKTASREYEPNSTSESVQLSQYLYTLGDKYKTEICGYVVFLKNISKNKVKVCKECGYNGSGAKHKTCSNIINEKRCNGEWTETIFPKARMQLIVDRIPEDFMLGVIDSIGEINDRINTGVITQELSKCDNFGYNKPCQFYALCHGGDTSNLIKIEKSIDKR